MKHNIFSIYDDKACFYAPPFFSVQIGSALRDFADLARDPKTRVNRHPSDFSLYHLGEYDDFNGQFLGFNEPRFVSRASEFMTPVLSNEA